MDDTISALRREGAPLRRDGETHVQTAKRVIAVWMMNIVTAAVIVLAIVLPILYFAVNDLRTDVRTSIRNQAEGQIRSCILLAQSSEFFPDTCVEPDIVVHLSGLVATLDTHGSQGKAREAICLALARQGATEADCA